ncbi:MAG: sensor histidine kinase [Actinomycetota bacterium]
MATSIGLPLVSLLASQVIDHRERERARVASHVYDVVLQDLAAVQLQADNIASFLDSGDDPRAKDLAVGVKEEMVRAISDLRGAIEALRRDGMRTQDLLQTLNLYVRSFQAETGIEVVVRLHCERCVELPISVVLLLSACCQEALGSIRSIRPSKVELTLSQLGGAVELRVRVKDPGPRAVTRDEDRWEPGVSREAIQFRPRKLRGGDLMVRIPIEGVEGLEAARE